MSPADEKLGKRIAVIGRGGKTSLARAISKQSELPFLELDSVTWLPNWKPREHGESVALIERWLDDHSEGWVIDGETNDSSGKQITARADCVIWLDLPFRTVLRRVVARSIRRVRSREQICGENYETWRRTLFSRNSLIYAHLAWYGNGRWKRYRRRIAALIEDLDPDQTILRIRSASELDALYDRYGLAIRDGSI